jgi:hypothetical protein
LAAEESFEEWINRSSPASFSLKNDIALRAPDFTLEAANALAAIAEITAFCVF